MAPSAGRGVLKSDYVRMLRFAQRQRLTLGTGRRSTHLLTEDDNRNPIRSAQSIVLLEGGPGETFTPLWPANLHTDPGMPRSRQSLIDPSGATLFEVNITPDLFSILFTSCCHRYPLNFAEVLCSPGVISFE
jgi:hypothetical protein